jgi:peptide/nickel transport system ATP-binding protein
MPLLEAVGIRKEFERGGTRIVAVDDVSIQVETGETVGVIGESGSGKSTLGRIAVGLMKPDSGSVQFDGKELTALSARELRRLRTDIQVVFQEPLESLDPRMRIIDIVREPLDIHARQLPREERRVRAHQTLQRVGLHHDLWLRRPAQLSGGEQQRVGIARAIISQPRVLLLDEPTSSLDLSLRAGILKLLLDLQRERHLTYIFVSHDMSTIEYVSDRIDVMYRGRIVETGPAKSVVKSPSHPYTRLLMNARLAPDPRVKRESVAAVLRPSSPLSEGCIFYDRCPIAIDECARTKVQLDHGVPPHLVACIRPEVPLPMQPPGSAAASTVDPTGLVQDQWAAG